MHRYVSISAVLLAACAGAAFGAEGKGKSMTYGEVKTFLARYTDVLEIGGPDGARVAICPQWQGRVMTSTCGGGEGASFGFVHEEFIRAGKTDLHFNNFGAEERLWLSPEGGQFSLWFKPGEVQKIDNWYTPPAFNEGAWQVTAKTDGKVCMATTMKLQNTSGTAFHLDVGREVGLLGSAEAGKLLGDAAAALLARPGVKMVGYETVNTLTNRGEPMTREKGLVSIWILGMMNCGPETVVIVPYKPGPVSEFGPVVKSDYFGEVPADRLKVLPKVALLRADGHWRSKIGVPQRRARTVSGSIDFAAGVLTLVHYNMPEDPTALPYMNNQWGGPHAEPYRGDVVNSYNDGPVAPGKPGLGPFYEIESLSPAKAMAAGESLTHRHRTIHVQADLATLDALAREVLGVDLETVRREMLGK
jgi:hypothetical protein